MKKDLGVIPAVFPMPVLMIATYDEEGQVNVMNAAWGMISDYTQIALFLGTDHKTTANIRKLKAFTVSIADRDHVTEADYFGIVSGNDVKDKFERAHLHAVKSTCCNAPVIEEFPVVMECELAAEIEVENMYAIVGNILNVQAEESVLNEKEKVDPQKLNALIFDQFQAGYYTVGEKVGQAWSSGRALIEEE